MVSVKALIGINFSIVVSSSVNSVCNLFLFMRNMSKKKYSLLLCEICCKHFVSMMTNNYETDTVLKGEIQYNLLSP